MSFRSDRLSRRNFLKVAGGASAALALAACAPSTAPQAGAGGDAAAPAEARTLNFWMWNTFAPPADEVLQDKVLEWGEANGVTIEISRDSDSNQQTKVMPALEAGTLPDALVLDSGAAELMRNSGGTTDLIDTFKELGEQFGGWQTNTEAYVTREGEVGFMPYSIDTPMTMFRTDWMEEAGIEVPEGQWTWDQTRDITREIMDFKEAQGDPKDGWGFPIVKQQHDGWCSDLFRNMEANVWDETGENIVLADNMDNAVRALNFAKEAFDMGLFPEDAAAYDTSSNNKFFQEDQGFLVINAASIYTWAQDNRPELAEAMGLAPKPSADLDTTSAGLRYVTVLTSQSENPTDALDLIVALYQPEIYEPWLEAGFVTNVLKQYDELEMWNDKRGAFNLAAQTGVYPGYPAPYNNAAIAELSGPNEPIGAMVVRVLIDNWTPEEAVLEADEFSRRVFEKYFG